MGDWHKALENKMAEEIQEGGRRQAKICLVIEATIQECREGPAVQ